MALSQTQRQLLLLAGALAITGVAGAYAYYGVFEAEKAEEARKSEDEKLVSFDVSQARKISVGARRTEYTVLVRDEEDPTWRILKPVETEADQEVVAALLARLAEVRRKKIVSEDPAEHPRFGVQVPTVGVTVELADGTKTSLMVGNDVEFDGSVYVRAFEKDTVYTADRSLRGPLEKGTFELREKRLLKFETADVKVLRVASATSSFTAERDERGAWSLTAPARLAGDADVLNRLVGTLRDLKATSFAAERGVDGSSFGLGPGASVLTVELRDGTARELVVGASGVAGAQKVHARSLDGPIAEVPATTLAAFDLPLFELVEKSIVRFDKNQVERVEFAGTGEQETFVVERRRQVKEGATSPEESWHVVSPKAAPAKKWKLASVLHALSTLKAAAFIEEAPKDLRPYGLDAPTRTITLFGAGGAELARLLVGGPQADAEHNVYVKSGAHPRVSRVDVKTLDALPKKAADVEDGAPVVPAPAAPATAPAVGN